MKLALYKGTQRGLYGIINRIIRWRLNSNYSHVELVFEAVDKVGKLMPDGDCDVNDRQQLWAFSSEARFGKSGGVRLKRIRFCKDKWDLYDINLNSKKCAINALSIINRPYDWFFILSHIIPFIKQKEGSFACEDAVSYALSINNYWNFNINNIKSIIKEK